LSSFNLFKLACVPERNALLSSTKCKLSKANFFRLNSQDVLFTMAYSSLVDTQATKSSLALRPRHVHVLLFGLIFPGEETLHHLLPSFPLRVIFHLLQLSRKLRILAMWWRGRDRRLRDHHVMKVDTTPLPSPSINS